MPDDKQQQTIDWQNDPDFHALPLAEKHKVLLQIDPDYKGLPAKEQAKALDAIHYGTLGQIPGEGISTTGAGTEAWEKIKGMFPPPEGPILSKQFWIGKQGPSMDFSKGGIAQAGREMSHEYQRSTAAGSNPVAAAGSAAVVGAGSLGTGLSNIEQEQLAEKGEGGKILGQSAVPAVAAAAAPFAEGALRTAGKLTPPGAVPAADVASAVMHPKTAALKFVAKRLFGEQPPPSPESTFPGAPFPAADEFYANRGAELDAIRKLNEQDAAKAARAAGKPAAEPIVSKVSEGPGPYTGPASAKAAAAAARKGGMKPPPPSPFSPEATSSATPIGSAELPAPGSPTLFPRVMTRAELAAAEAAKRQVPAPSPFGNAVSSATPIGSAELPPPGQPTPFPRVMSKAELAAQMAPPPKPAPPSPFGGMTSSATPIGSAELPPVPQGQPVPFPPVEKAIPPAKTAEPLRGLKQRVGSAGDLARWSEPDLWAGYMQNIGTPLGEAIAKELASRGLVKTVEGQVRAGVK